MKVTWSLCSILFTATATQTAYVNATNDIVPPNNVVEKSMTHHEMLHSTRQLTVEDVQSMSFFADLYRTKESNDPKIGSSLHDLIAAEASGLATNEFLLKHGLVVSETRTVLVDVVGDSVVDLEDVLQKNGYVSTTCYKHMCSLNIAIDKIAELASLPQVASVRASISFHHGTESNSKSKDRNRDLQVQLPISVGKVTSQGVVAHNIDKARAKYKVNGTGILIGVLGTSFDCLKGAVNDTLSGDLPLNITFLGNNTGCPPSDTDDGRLIMQTIYDVAPGATFAFYALGTSQARGVYEGQIAMGVKTLVDAGCSIIAASSRVYALDEPFFQHGPAAQAVDDAIARGVLYYSFLPGYIMGAAWDAPSGFVPSGIAPPNSTGQFHLFGNRSDGTPIISQRVGLRKGAFPAADVLVLQWDQPFFKVSGAPGCQSDLDIILSINGTVQGAGTDSNIGKDAGEAAFVVPFLSGSSNSTVVYDMFIIHRSGPLPKFMKITMAVSGGTSPLYEFPTNSTHIVGISNSALVTTVGGVSFMNTPAFGVSPPNVNGILLSFGVGNPIVFDKFGNRTANPTTRNSIRFRAVTETLTTISNSSFTNTAHVAGIAALILQAKGGPKSLTPQQVNQFLESTAIDMDDPLTPGFDVGFDNRNGFGFIDALAALDAATTTKAPTRVPSKKPTKAPSKKPTKAPSKNPTKGPTKAPERKPCGLFGLSLFCPITFCGFFGRLFNYC